MKIIRGKVPAAVKAVIYGQPGIGKSTLAGQFPDPVFIDTEGGTKHLDIARFERPKTWSMLMQQVDYVRREKPCKTLVIDTVDWAERLCIQHIVSEQNSSKIQGLEDFGYGKGYVYLAEEMGRLLNRLSEVVQEGIHVVLLAHSTTRKFDPPGGDQPYDRYEMKLERKTLPLVKEWADMILYLDYEVIVIQNQGQKAQGHGGERVMYTTYHPAWDAKNRFDLPEKLPLSFQSLAPVFEQATSAPSEVSPVIQEAPPTAEEPQDLPEFELQYSEEPELTPLEQLIQSAGATVGQFMMAIGPKDQGGTGNFPAGTAYDALPQDFIEYAISQWESLYLPQLMQVMQAQ